MTHNWLRTGIIFAAGIVFVAVALPLLLVLAFVMRPLLLLVAIPALLGSLVLYAFSPRFRKQFAQVGEPKFNYYGLRLAMDVTTYASHSWARIRRGKAVVGVDDLVQATLGPVEAVELPPIGHHVKQGDRLFLLQRGDRSLEVRAPLSGCVVTRNESLLDHPALINEVPFSEGWAVQLQADNLSEDRQQLLEGKEARSWYRGEVDRFIGTVLCREAVAPTLPDGGVLSPDLYRQIDDDTWTELTGTFFGAASP